MTVFGGQCPDNNAGQNVYDTGDNLFSINPTQIDHATSLAYNERSWVVTGNQAQGVNL